MPAGGLGIFYAGLLARALWPGSPFSGGRRRVRVAVVSGTRIFVVVNTLVDVSIRLIMSFCGNEFISNQQKGQILFQSGDFVVEQPS